MKCPRCGADSSGAFCSHCGAELTATRTCASCGGTLPPGARYCIHCGARAGAAPAPMRWVVLAAVAIVALGLGYWLGAGGEDGAASPVATMPVTAADEPGSRTPPPLTGTPREQADRLFERVMQARARGDSAEVTFFLPIALQAYERAAPLDPDGHFHVGLLLLGAGRVDEARAAAARIAEADPNHLFGPALLAEAALEANDEAAASSAFAQFLARFDDEIARGLPEYQLHRPALDEYHERARAVAGS